NKRICVLSISPKGEQLGGEEVCPQRIPPTMSLFSTALMEMFFCCAYTANATAPSNPCSSPMFVRKTIVCLNEYLLSTRASSSTNAVPLPLSSAPCATQAVSHNPSHRLSRCDSMMMMEGSVVSNPGSTAKGLRCC